MENLASTLLVAIPSGLLTIIVGQNTELWNLVVKFRFMHWSWDLSLLSLYVPAFICIFTLWLQLLFAKQARDAAIKKCETVLELSSRVTYPVRFDQVLRNQAFGERASLIAGPEFRNELQNASIAAQRRPCVCSSTLSSAPKSTHQKPIAILWGIVSSVLSAGMGLLLRGPSADTELQPNPAISQPQQSDSAPVMPTTATAPQELANSGNNSSESGDEAGSTSRRNPARKAARK